MDNTYRSLIVDLYKNPANKREIKNAEIKASGANVTCGDSVRVYLKLSRGFKIKDASFQGEGCAISIAAASLLTLKAKGKSLKEVANWGTAEIFDWLGGPLGPNRVKCGLLALETMQTGIAKFKNIKKRPQPFRAAGTVRS